ncbi:MAG: biopolymer transporter ExbD [Spongiibacteraceae bacterium]
MSRQRRTALVVHKDNELGNDDNMIPLINIVFLLLIFFMVAGHISQLSEGALNLPKTMAERSADEEALVLQMNTEQQLFLNGEQIELADLEPVLKGDVVLAAGLARYGLALQVDKTVTAAELDPVLSTLRQIGIAKVQLHALLDLEPTL